MKKTKTKGITLVALVVTIVVLLILAGITITLLFSDNGIITKAQEAKNATENDQINTEEGLNNLENQMEQKLIDAGVGGSSSSEPQVTLADGTTVTLTKENVKDYLGMRVTNYEGQSSVEIGGTTYTASPIYRLYYVDFDNKYKDGAGTIYLKAENMGYEYFLPTDESSATDSNIKIKSLNPALYANGVTSPDAGNNNMKAVTWLTNTTNWANLKTTDTTIASKVNYIVGAPSLEIMMDSYNTYYVDIIGNATEPIATGSRDSSSERVKLFYQYTGGDYGYKVGPSESSAYDDYTADYTVKSDSAIDTMYYPGSYYWLASPANDPYRLMRVNYYGGGIVDYASYTSDYALCPLVSLKSDVSLELEAWQNNNIPVG